LAAEAGNSSAREGTLVWNCRVARDPALENVTTYRVRIAGDAVEVEV
jgi:hypothetical protein